MRKKEVRGCLRVSWGQRTEGQKSLLMSKSFGQPLSVREPAGMNSQKQKPQQKSARNPLCALRSRPSMASLPLRETGMLY